MLNLIRYEWNKIQRQTKIVLLILTLMIGSAFALLYEIAYDVSNGYTALEEKALFSEMEEMEPESRSAYLEQKAEEIREELVQMTKAAEEEPAAEEQKITQMLAEYQFYMAEIQAFEECEGYSELLESLSEGTGGLLATGLGKSNVYLKNYNEKISGMYEALERREITLVPSSAVRILTDLSWNDVFLLLAVALVVFQVIYQEKREETESLILCTPKGYRGIWKIKLWTVNLAAFFLYLLFKSLQWILVWKSVGIPQAGLPIQSVKEYLYCPYNMTIGDTLFCTSMWKLGAVVVTANVFFMSASVLHDQIMVWIAEILCVILQFLQWNQIHYGMWCGGFKEGTLFAMLSPGHYYKQAICINVFQIPVEIKWAGIGFAIVVLSAAVLISRAAWKHPRQIQIKKQTEKQKKYTAKRNIVLNRKISLVHFERKRLWNWSRAGILLLVMVLAQFALNYHETGRTEMELYYEYYCNRVIHETGKGIEQKVQKEKEWIEEQQMLLEQTETQYLNGELSEEQYWFRARQYKTPETRLMAFEQFQQQFETVRGRESLAEIRLFYETGWQNVFGDAGKRSVKIDLAVFLIGAVLAFSQFGTLEYQFRMFPLIQSKKHGKKEYERQKIRCCAEWTIGSIWILTTVRFVVLQYQYHIWNTDILRAQMGCFSFAEEWLWKMPAWTVLLAVVLFEWIIGLIIMSVILWGAKSGKNLRANCD